MDNIEDAQQPQDQRTAESTGLRKPYIAPSVQTADTALNALLASGCPPVDPLQE